MRLNMLDPGKKDRPLELGHAMVESSNEAAGKVFRHLKTETTGSPDGMKRLLDEWYGTFRQAFEFAAFELEKIIESRGIRLVASFVISGVMRKIAVTPVRISYGKTINGRSFGQFQVHPGKRFKRCGDKNAVSQHNGGDFRIEIVRAAVETILCRPMFPRVIRFEFLRTFSDKF